MEALKRRPMLPTLHYYVGMASQELGTERDMEVCENMCMCVFSADVY